MSVERNLLISLLKLTKNGPVLTELVKREAHLSAAVMSKLLAKLQNEDLVYLKQGCIEVESENRLTLAVQALSLGADVEDISNLLCWQEFEEIAGYVLKNNGFTVSNNVRFQAVGSKMGNRCCRLQETVGYLHRLQTLATCYSPLCSEENR